MYHLNKTSWERDFDEVLCSLLSPRARLTKMPKASWIKGLRRIRTVRESTWNATRFGEANQTITASKWFKPSLWMRVRPTMANIESIQGISGCCRQHEYKGYKKSNLQDRNMTSPIIGHATKIFRSKHGSLISVRLYAANDVGEGGSWEEAWGPYTDPSGT